MNERIRELAEQAAKYSAIMALPTGQSGNELFVAKFAKLVAEHEREECAKLCDDMDSTSDYYGPRIELICAEAIRARGEA
jgi:hypothetical protein